MIHQQNNQKSLIAIIAWCLYDWANSAYFTIVTTFIFATYFTEKIAINKIIGTHQWGNAVALSGLIIAILSPILGSIADFGGYRKHWLFLFNLVGILASACLWFAYPSNDFVFLTLILFVLSTIGFELAFVFYNSLLPSVAPRNYLGRISGWAWGCGYCGGLLCLIIALFVFIQHPPPWLSQKSYAQVRICGPLIAGWISIFSLPLFLFVRDMPSKNLSALSAIQQGLKQLFITLKSLPNNKPVLLFLIAQMIYIDGLNTLFSFGGIYAAGTFGMTITEVVQFGITLNITAGLGAAVFAWIDDWLGAKNTILISLIFLVAFGIGTLLIHSKLWFWIFAVIIGVFVGPTQAASRSLMAQLSSQDQISEMFGLYALTGKATAFIGPWLVGATTLFFNSQRAGMATIFIFFLLGGILLNRVKT